MQTKTFLRNKLHKESIYQMEKNTLSEKQMQFFFFF